MGKKFREWAPDQTWLLPPSPRDWLDDGHLVYFLLDVVGEMDLSPFFERYKNSVTGQPPFHPRMMVTLLLYSYCSGVFSSRKIQSRCHVDVAFRVIVGEDIPDFRTSGNARLTGFCNELLSRKKHLWTFLKLEGIEPANNTAERALRPAVIYRKLSFGTQSDSGSRYLERILTVSETCRLQNRNAYEYLVESMRSKFAGRIALSLMPDPVKPAVAA